MNKIDNYEFSRFRETVKCHIWTITQFIFSILFSLMPLLIDAAIKASDSKTNYSDELYIAFSSGAVFIYTAALIAPFFIFTISQQFKKDKDNSYMYPLVLILCTYTLLLGSLTYAGAIDRELFQFSRGTTVLFPSYLEISIIISAFITWYYCTYQSSRYVGNSIEIYKHQQEEYDKKFSEVMD